MGTAPQVRIWPGTRRKIERIAEHDRRSMTATIDVIADAYLDANKIADPDVEAPDDLPGGNDEHSDAPSVRGAKKTSSKRRPTPGRRNRRT